jgi:hypothetical protein
MPSSRQTATRPSGRGGDRRALGSEASFLQSKLRAHDRRPAALPAMPEPAINNSTRSHQEGRIAGQNNSGLWRSLVSVLDWGSRGRGFKSRQPDHVR